MSLLEKIFEELCRPHEPISNARLVGLSGLGSEEMELFAKGWARIPWERRRKVLSMLVELAEDNVELDFNPLLRHALHDKDDEVRATAIAGLWECEERSLIMPLVRLLNDDPNEKVRAAAAQALGRFALLAETGKLLQRDATRVADALLAVIDNEEETLEVRRRAIEAIAPMSLPRVAEVIQEAYEQDDPKMKSSALYAMGLNCDHRWFPILLSELHSEEPEFRYEAAAALGEVGEEDAVPELIPLLQDSDAQVQAGAINALGCISGVMAKAALVQALKDGDPRIAEMVEAALETMGFEEEPLAFRLRTPRRP